MKMKDIVYKLLAEAYDALYKKKIQLTMNSKSRIFPNKKTLKVLKKNRIF